MLNPQAKEKVWLTVRNAECRLCPLYKEAQSVCLLGDGPVPTRIMLVGEAPGAREDDIGRPFSGPAGRYLDRILAEVGLPRDSVYITNAVRCRPPENATPTPGQIKACSTYMVSELEIVKPEFVLVMGNAALKSILKQSGIMKKRGTATMLGGRTVFATVHPAAVLRNPGLETAFKSDLLSFARLTRGEERRPETKSSLITNSKGLSRLCQMLATVETPISFDVETGTTDPDEEEGGLNSWSPNAVIHTVSFTWEPGTSYVVALEHPENPWDIPIKRVYEALNVALAGKKMIGHNIKFDCLWMKAKGVDLHAFFDTRGAAGLLDENQPGGLKPLSRTYLGADEYEAGISFKPGQAAPLRKLAVYNGKDTDYTFRLFQLFRDELKKQPRLEKLFMRLWMPACRAFIEFEQVGFPVDMERLERRHRSILHKIAQVTDEMMEMVPEELQPYANFRSPKFLGDWFFRHLKLPVVVTTPKGAPSTNESALLQLMDKSPAVAKLMELRKWQKNESTYTRNWLRRTTIAGKPRLFTSYNLSGTVTGRLSSNMQQVPRDVYIRSIIGTEPGWKFIEADFSQVELRLAAMFSGDPTLTRAFIDGEDPHRQTAAKVLRKPQGEVTKDERKMAKAVNFGFLYGMGWRKFRIYAKEKYQTEVTDQEAQAYRKAFFDEYSALESWHQRQRRIVRNLGQVTSPIGRIRHLPSINSTDEDQQGMAEREAINAPVQGFASDLTVLAMVVLNKRLDLTRAHILGNVHDAILLEATDDYADEAASITKEVMENLPLKKLFNYEPTVPIEAEVTIGTHWGEH